MLATSCTKNNERKVIDRLGRLTSHVADDKLQTRRTIRFGSEKAVIDFANEPNRTASRHEACSLNWNK